MLTFKRTTSDNPDFEKLVVQLDAYLAILDGEDHAFYSQFNKSSLLKNALIVYENENPIAIGAYKEYDAETAEMKRMFTLPEYRGKGIASKVLTELDELGATTIIKTSRRQRQTITNRTRRYSLGL
jgi:putative acetyltransferase